jgi:copper homeostasis protein
MIRPRAGNFRYSTAEFEAMRHDIALFAPLASGFVFGILDKAGKVDVARNSELVDIAAPLPCTFHRAVDEIAGKVEEAVESIIACGFKSILTSGGGKNADDGLERLRMLQEKFGSRVSLIVGGGVRSGNVERIRSGAGVQCVHSAAITGDGEEVDEDEVRKIREALGVGMKEGNGDQEMDG